MKNNETARGISWLNDELPTNEDFYCGIGAEIR